MSDEYTTPVPNVIDLTDYSDPSVNLDDIPISERISGRELCGLPPVEDIRAGEFLRMPLSRYMSDRMPPVARLLLVLEWRYCLHGPDFDAGWVLRRFWVATLSLKGSRNWQSYEQSSNCCSNRPRHPPLSTNLHCQRGVDWAGPTSHA